MGVSRARHSERTVASNSLRALSSPCVMVLHLEATSSRRVEISTGGAISGGEVECASDDMVGMEAQGKLLETGSEGHLAE